MNTLAFQIGDAGGGARRAVAPEPEPLPEREWGLSAWQVVAVVVAIVAACELVGAFG